MSKTKGFGDYIPSSGSRKHPPRGCLETGFHQPNLFGEKHKPTNIESQAISLRNVFSIACA